MGPPVCMVQRGWAVLESRAMRLASLVAGLLVVNFPGVATQIVTMTRGPVEGDGEADSGSGYLLSLYVMGILPMPVATRPAIVLSVCVFLRTREVRVRPRRGRRGSRRGRRSRWRAGIAFRAGDSFCDGVTGFVGRIVTTFPGGGYAAAWGTSYSTPFVSGAVAMLANRIPNFTPSEAEAAVRRATPVSPELGAGVLNLPLAVPPAQ